MTVKEMFSEVENRDVKIHFRYSDGKETNPQLESVETLKNEYGDCQAEVVEYEKDYGDDAIITRRFVRIYVGGAA